MAEIPQLSVEAFLVGDDESRVAIGPLEIGRALASTISQRPWAREEILAGEVFIHTIRGSIPHEHLSRAFAGELSLPGLVERIVEFDKAISGLDGWKALDEANELVWAAAVVVKERQDLLTKVSAASWEPDPTKHRYFYGSQFTEFYSEEPVRSDHGWDAYGKIDPYPTGFRDLNEPNVLAWQGRYEAWKRKDAQPFAFATTERHWEGVCAKGIRDDYVVLAPGETDGDEVGPIFGSPIDVSSLVDDNLSDFYEDAHDDVVDLDGLEEIIAAWMPHAATGDSEDLALEGKVAEWNGKQRILGYWPDEGTAVAGFPDVTREEALDWCRRSLAQAQEAVLEARQSWRAPSEDLEAVLAP